MKKPTVKAAKTLAPAKKAPDKVVKKAAAAPVKRAVTPATKASAVKEPTVKAPTVKAPPVKATTVKAPTAKAPAVKPAASVARATEITALIDIGFGNTLYLRGEGPGLSWDVGFPLDCVSDGKWSISLPDTGKAVVYKFLINDLCWSAGSDFVAESGAKVSVEPTF